MVDQWNVVNMCVRKRCMFERDRVRERVKERKCERGMQKWNAIVF